MCILGVNNTRDISDGINIFAMPVKNASGFKNIHMATFNTLFF